MPTNEEKRAAALAFLGTRHVLHTHYSGRVSHSETNVRLTIKRVKKQQAEAEKKSVEAHHERIARRRIGGA